ncbi:MAG: tetratricopeptide repeat protein [Cytophagales bacterium]|nr:tetratricopeptide repeat protein [Cytophagales bacterium]
MITSTTSLGDAHRDLIEYKKAEEYYELALATARELKMSTEIARVLHQSGLLFRRTNEPDKARERFKQSMAISQQLGDSTNLKKTRSELIGLDLAEQNRKSTETELLKNLNTLIGTGDRQQEAIEYAHLSEYYAVHKEFEKALYYLKKHEALSDSVEGSEVLLQMKVLEEQYESEKKEKEIVLLKKDQELQALALSRERTNVALIAFALISVLIISVLLVNRYRVKNRTNRLIELERMRNTIARDLHDDIGSTLSSINIMSQLALK